jgi:hypothetical protein
MKISTAGIKLLACGALVAIGVTVGSGTAHASLVQPTAEQCKLYAQYAIDEGEGETLAQELLEHGFDPAGCPSGPVVAGECVLGHNTVTGEHCYTEGYSDPLDRPAGYPVPAADCRDTIDYDGDYDCTPWPPATVTAGVASPPVVAPVAVNGVTVSNAAPAATAAATPAKPATVSTPALAVAAKPAATPAATVKALPLTGGNISGVVLFALASLGIGVALRRFDKRRRLTA